jgi:hypothetical protein
MIKICPHHSRMANQLHLESLTLICMQYISRSEYSEPPHRSLPTINNSIPSPFRSKTNSSNAPLKYSSSRATPSSHPSSRLALHDCLPDPSHQPAPLYLLLSCSSFLSKILNPPKQLRRPPPFQRQGADLVPTRQNSGLGFPASPPPDLQQGNALSMVGTREGRHMEAAEARSNLIQAQHRSGLVMQPHASPAVACAAKSH